MARDVVRAGAAGVLALGAEVAVGIWLLFLFLLALAWDPFDRRFGFHDRRHPARPEAPSGAYGLGGPPADGDGPG